LTELVVIGAGGFASYVLDVAEALGINVRMLIDDRPDGDAGSTRHGFEVSPWPTARDVSGAELFVAIGHNSSRAAATAQFRAAYPEVPVATLVHPTASISSSARVGRGSIVMAGASIGRGATLGQGVLVDAGAVIAHDCVADDFASFAAGVVTGGYAQFGARTAIGLNAAVLEQIQIGSDVVVGAGSVVNSGLPNRVMAFGVPARVQRERDPEEPYLR